MAGFFTLKDIEVRGKRVLVRVDYNVPQNKETLEITDDKRIRETLPTINYLLEHGASVILCSHLGRPNGKPEQKYSLAPIAKRLESLLGKPVHFAKDCRGESAQSAVKSLKSAEVLLLENLRFHPEEEANDPAFSKELASLADLFVNDAFGTMHRAHASTQGVTNYLKSAAGLLVEKEIRMIGGVLQSPKHPFVVILGGSKVTDKAGVIKNMLKTADHILIGGAMMFSFYAAEGKQVGKSKIEPEGIGLAKELLTNKKIGLPIDTVVASEFSSDAQAQTVDIDSIPVDMMGLDIGPQSIKKFESILKDAKTVVWGGPMGVFEFDQFATGTKEIARILSELHATTIVGGGDSAAAVAKFGYEKKLTHVSTGGGASLEYLEGKDLPGITALELSHSKYS